MSKCGHILRIFNNKCWVCKVSCCKKCKVKCQDCGQLTCGKCNNEGLCINCSQGITDSDFVFHKNDSCNECGKVCIPLDEDSEFKEHVDDCANRCCNVLCCLLSFGSSATLNMNPHLYSAQYTWVEPSNNKKSKRRYHCRNCNLDFYKTKY